MRSRRAVHRPFDAGEAAEGEGEQGSPGEVVWRGQPGVAPESDGHRHRMEP